METLHFFFHDWTTEQEIINYGNEIEPRICYALNLIYTFGYGAIVFGFLLFACVMCCDMATDVLCVVHNGTDKGNWLFFPCV